LEFHKRGKVEGQFEICGCENLKHKLLHLRLHALIGKNGGIFGTESGQILFIKTVSVAKN